MLKRPADLDLMFKFASVAAELGKNEAAISTLERMLLFNRNLPRVKLELGVLYFKLGSYDVARNYFNDAVSGSNVPDSVKQRVKPYLAEIDKRTERNHFAGSLTFGLRYQTNANVGPSSNHVLALGFDAVLNSTFLNQADWNAFASGYLADSYDLNPEKTQFWDTTLQLYYARQFDLTNLNLGFAEATTGPRFLLIPDQGSGLSLRPFALANVVTLGDAPDFETIGGGIELDKAFFGDRLQTSLGYTNRYEIYEDTDARPTNDQFTGDMNTISFTGSYSLTPTLQLGLAGYFSTQDANADFNANDAYSIAGTISKRYAAPFALTQFPWETDLSVRGTWTNYDAPNPAVDPTTSRDDTELLLTLSNTIGLTQDLSALLQVQYTHHASNLAELSIRRYRRSDRRHLVVLKTDHDARIWEDHMTWLRGLLIVALLVPALARAEDKTVGTTAAVNPDATGTPPGGQSQTLLIGTDVVFKETIKTVDKGQTQILFVDQSTLTVAPNSEIVLDEFVYDPNTSTGKMAISLGKGLLRFVGGSISHTNGATINTPTTSLTVRGGMAIVQSDAAGTNVLTIFGTTTIQPKNGGAGAQTVSTPGTLTTVAGSGKVSTTQATGGQIQALYTQLQGPSSTGGVTVAEVNQQLGDQGMAGGSQPSSGSSGGAASNGSSSGNTGSGASGNDTGGASTDISGIQSQTNFTQTTQQQTSQSGSTTPAVVLGPFDGRYMSTPAPYTTDFGDFFNDPAAENAVGGAIGTHNNQGFTNAQISDGRLTINLATPDTTQTLIDLPIQPGNFTVSGPTTTPAPGSLVTGTGFYDPTIGFFYYDLIPANGTQGQGVIVGGTPTPNGGLLPGGLNVSYEAWNISPDLSTSIPTLPGAVASQFPNATVSPMLAVFQAGGTIGVPDVNNNTDSHYLWAALDIEGQGDSQKSMLIGTSGGFFGDGGFLYVNQGERGMINPGGGSPVLRINADIGSIPSAGATQTSSSNEFFGPDLNYFALQNNDTAGGNGAYETDSAFIGAQDFSTAILYGYTALASKTSTPAGLGTNRSSRTMNGYFADLGQSYIPLGTGYQTPYAITNANGLPTDMSLTTDTSTNSIRAILNFADVSPLSSDSVQTGKISFAGLGYGRSAYVDDQHLAALETINPNLAGNINGDTGLPMDTYHVDGFRSFMLSHDEVGTSGLLPAGVSLCTCDFLQWGYWVSQFRWDRQQREP